MRSDFQGTQSSKSSGARTRTAVLLWKTNTRSSLSGQRRALKPRSRIFRALEGPTVKSQVGNKGLALVFLSPETQGPRHSQCHVSARQRTRGAGRLAGLLPHNCHAVLRTKGEPGSRQRDLGWSWGRPSPGGFPGRPGPALHFPAADSRWQWIVRNLGRRPAGREDPAWRKTWLGFGRGAERNAPRGGARGPPRAGGFGRPEPRSARTWEAAPEQDLKGSLGLLAPMWLRGHAAPSGTLDTQGRALPTTSLARASARRGNLLPELIAFSFSFLLLNCRRSRGAERSRGLAVATARARGRAGFEPRRVCPEPVLPAPTGSPVRGAPGPPAGRLSACPGARLSGAVAPDWFCLGPGAVPGGAWPRWPFLRPKP